MANSVPNPQALPDRVIYLAEWPARAVRGQSVWLRVIAVPVVVLWGLTVLLVTGPLLVGALAWGSVRLVWQAMK